MLEVVLETMLEVMRCVLLCIPEAVEGGLCLLEALETLKALEMLRTVEWPQFRSLQSATPLVLIRRGTMLARLFLTPHVNVLCSFHIHQMFAPRHAANMFTEYNEAPPL